MSAFFEGMNALLDSKARSLSQDIAELKELIRGEGKNDATNVDVFVQSYLTKEDGSKTKRQAVVLLVALGIVLNEKIATVGHHKRLREVLTGCSQFEPSRLLATKEVMVVIKVIDNLIKKKVIAKELYSELATPFIELLQEDTKEEGGKGGEGGPADNKKQGKWIHPSITAAVGKSADAVSSPEVVETDYTTYLCCHVLDAICEAINPNPAKEIILTAFEICHRALRGIDADMARENVSALACTCLWMAYKAWEGEHPSDGVVESILHVYTKTVSVVPFFNANVGPIEMLKTNMEDFEGSIKLVLGGDFVPNPPLKMEGSEFELCCRSLSASSEDAKSALRILCHRAYKYSPLCLTFDAVVVSLAALVIAKGTTKTEVDSLALSFGVDSALILSACVSLGRYKTDSLKPLRARFEAEAATAAASAIASASEALKLNPTSFPEQVAQSAPYNPFLDVVAKPDENEKSHTGDGGRSDEAGNRRARERKEEGRGSRDGERNGGRDSRSRERDVRRHNDRSRERDRDRGRERSRERDRDKGRDWSRERSRDRGRDWSRERERDRGRERSRERDRGRGRDWSRERSRDRGRDRSRERSRDRSRGHRDETRNNDRSERKAKKEKKEKKEKREKREREGGD